MKILLVAEDYYPIKAGGAFVDTEVAEAAAERGFDVTVFTMRLDDTPRSETHNGVDIRRPVRPPLNDRPYGSFLNVLGRCVAIIAFALYVLRYSSGHDIDVIYSTNHLVHPVSRLASVLNGASLITFVGYSPSQHEAERRYSNPLYLLEQINFRFMLGERVYCRDPTVRDVISAVSSGSTAQIVHGILNEAEFRAAASDLDSYEQPTVRALADAPETTLLLFVGKLSQNKRPELAVQILSELPDRYELVVVGDGEQRAAAEATARRAGRADSVHFVGELTHVRTLQSMLLADGLLLTSMTESYSAVVLEALACSCAAFSTPVGVVPEIADEVSRLHVCEADAMARAVLDADPLQSAAVVDDRIVEMFPIERFTRTICEAFERTTGRDPTMTENVTTTD